MPEGRSRRDNTSPNRLVLKGRVQVETALGALMCTGSNPDAQNRLQLFLDLHTEYTSLEAQEDLFIACEGGTTAQDKADITAGLEELVTREDTPADIRHAAAALYGDIR